VIDAQTLSMRARTRLVPRSGRRTPAAENTNRYGRSESHDLRRHTHCMPSLWSCALLHARCRNERRCSALL
jgi:hypothetical protein